MKPVITFIAFIFFVSVGLHGQTVESKEVQQFVSDFDTYIQEILKNLDVPAVGVAIAKDGNPVFIKAYGFADREKGIKADNNTLSSFARR